MSSTLLVGGAQGITISTLRSASWILISDEALMLLGKAWIYLFSLPAIGKLKEKLCSLVLGWQTAKVKENS